MKKIIIGIVALVALAIAVCIWNAQAAIHRTQSFINGSAFFLSNNASIGYGNTTVQYTNSSGTLTLSTNVGAFVDANLWSDLNGNAPSGATITIKWRGAAAIDTNIITVTLVRSGDGVNFDTNTDSGSKSWSFVTPTSSSLTNGVLTTNLPAWFMQGSAKLRLLSIKASDAGGTASIIEGLSLNGYVP